jgi:hypothetical protein
VEDFIQYTLADISALQVEHALDEYFEREDAEIDSFYEVKYGWSGHVPGLGDLKYGDSYGGEGKGEEYWVAFSITSGAVSRHFRKDGFYSSYGGGAEWDSNLREVWPKQKVITVWE